jgi:hypothetical protein
MEDDKTWTDRAQDRASARAVVLAVLGALTLGVAALSIKVSYQILDPHFGAWAAPTVAALDLLWVVLQVTEILAGSNVRRARLVRWPGLALTVGIAAIPTADLIMSGAGGDLAVVITPAAILATKAVWWFVLRSLGRRVSPETRRTIVERRQAVADRLEQMEADAAARMELLRVEGDLKEQIAKAEDDYRCKILTAQKKSVDRLHSQAQSTAESIAKQPLPTLVAEIALPTFEDWEPSPLALPVTPAALAVSQVSDSDRDAEAEASRHAQLLVTVEEIATVTGVPTPVPGEQLDDKQIGVVLRALRYREDPPMSGRQARAAYRAAGFVGSEHKIRPIWRELADEAEESEEAEDSEESDRRN